MDQFGAILGFRLSGFQGLVCVVLGVSIWFYVAFLPVMMMMMMMIPNKFPHLFSRAAQPTIKLAASHDSRLLDPSDSKDHLGAKVTNSAYWCIYCYRAPLVVFLGQDPIFGASTLHFWLGAGSGSLPDLPRRALRGLGESEAAPGGYPWPHLGDEGKIPGFFDARLRAGKSPVDIHLGH